MGLRDFTLFDIVERNARLHPSRLAFALGDERVTHAAYRARAERLGAGLARAGVRPGDRVGVVSQNNLEFVDLYGAVARLGAILVPVNWRLSADEVAYVVADAAPKIVIADAANQPLLQAAHSSLPMVERWYGIGTNSGPFAPYADLLGGADQGALAAPHSDADAGLVMIHTAAVGGRPRGALLSHANLIAASAQLLHYWSLTPDDVNLGALPLFHVAGLGMLLAAQYAGGASIIVPKFDAGTALDAIHRQRVTMLAEFPPILTTLLDAAEIRPDELSSLRIATGLDSPETITRFERLCPQARFWSVFGQSETSGFVTMGRFRDRPGAAGQPTFLATVAVLDDADNPVAPGEVGEIAVRGPTHLQRLLALRRRQCLHLPQRLASHRRSRHVRCRRLSLVQGPLAGQGADQAGRRKRLSGGSRARDRGASGDRGSRRHRRPRCAMGRSRSRRCAAANQDRRATAQEIIDFVGGRIARYKRPKFVAFVDAMPKTAAGAIDRAKVKETHGHA